ncbi:uncharacterized protein LOC123208802 isoform X2 [Mangifera indica]|uniref:uncharacterized protein LOC123208802 isoform X2 n=1 Tax=Mangifera indica TaxID=29780 RepID=UPI001CFBE265|nr:uncharacterized protein LOC123208802 isoform X2 [Mangifera indica]
MVEVAGSVGGVLSPVLQVAQWLAAPIWRPFKYLYNYTTNFKNLEAEVDKLKNTREEVERKIIAAKRNVEVIYENVEKWQDSAQEMIDKAEQLIKEKEQFIREKANNPRCFKGLCSNFIIHYKQSRKAFKLKRDDIDPLLQQELGTISYRTKPPEIWLRPSEDYLAFESRNSTVKNVWDALNDENVFMIGVYGMGGLGKTTLVEEIGRKAEKDKLFEDIVFVEVSKSPDVKKIQTTIANKLGLKFENESEMANKLYSRMKDKNILLILDNIWEPLGLERIVGIPCGADRGKNKLLFTTRNEDVLKTMGSTNNFGMGFLNDDEAWALFTKMADLLRHVLCLNILKGANLTMEDARDRLDKLIRELKDACLLLNGFKSGQFAMHDVIRDVAITIAYVHHHVFTTRNDIERDWKDRDKLKKCTKIFLPNGNTVISQLWPNDLDCPNLEYVSMSCTWNSSFKIPNELFTVMPKLKVLNLVGLQQSSLPSSINFLTNLQTLCLDDSNVKDVAIIGKLNKLKILSLQCSYIKEFPTDMGQLTQLRLLDLSYCENLEVIAPNVISKLSQLEELYLHGCHIQRKIDELFEELMFLSSLNSLELDIKDEKVLPEDFFSRKLIRYRISVGNWFFHFLKFVEREHLRILQLIINPTIYLEELCGIKNVKVLWLAEYLDDLEHSKFKLQSNEITPLFNKKVIFPDLKILVLMNIISRKIWDSQLPSSSFENLKELTLRRCTKIKFVFPYAITKNLQQLQYLEIKDCIDLEEIVAIEEITEAAASFVFPEVTSLKLENLPELATFYPGIHTLECPKLKKLEVKNCDKFKMLNSEPNSLCLDYKVHFRDLEVLKLENISSEKIWDSQLSTSSYQTLTHLTLFECDKIKHVFPLSIAKSLQQLQYLELVRCKVLEIIVAPEEGTEAAVNFSFPQVTKVKLQYLPKFTDFYPGIHTLEWPKLRELEIAHSSKCKMLTSKPIFLCFDQKINHDLQILKLQNGQEYIHWSQFKELKFYSYESTHIPLWPLQRFENLICLFVDRCKFFNLTTPSIATSLVQLRELKISNCETLVEILEIEEDATIEIVFENLSKLSFDSIESLVCFCSRNYTFNFPSLEELNITNCYNMMTFCKGILSTPKLQKINYEKMEVENEGNDLNKTIQGLYKKKNQDISLDLNLKYKAFNHDNSPEIGYNQHPTSFYQNLTHLFLWKCENIKYAFPSSIAKSLHQLQQLKIQNCWVLKEIVAKEGANAVVDFIFPNITLLKLEYLPELTVFYPGIYSLEMPKLKELVVNCCTKYASLKENIVETEFNILDPKSIFLDNKINFNLEVFKLYDHGTKICWQSLSRTLTINNDISTNILLRLFQRFENVRELQLSCSQHKDIESLCDLPNLEILEVNYCSRLMTLVPLSGSFQNLKVLKVSLCNGLIMKLITLSMAKSLTQLRELSISYCDMLTEIVDNEGDATSTEIVFNGLNKLSFKGLKNLKCFCFGNYSFNFPSLEELIIGDCPNLEIFCQGSICTPKLDRFIYKYEVGEFVGAKNVREVEIGDNDLNTTIQQEYQEYQEYKKQVSSSWIELILSGRNIMTTLQGEFQENPDKVETLRLIKDDHAYIRIHILEKFINLEELILIVSSYEEIFSCEEGEEYVGALSKLKVLQLQGLFNLKCIWKQDFRFKSVLQNLHSLNVKRCHNLMTLLPSSSSFKNLMTLKVKDCSGMQNLMTFSTAKSLVCLKTLSIKRCEMMIEVLANEGDIEKDEVVFERLKKLSLFNLESLTCFYYGNYTLKFPFLESLVVDKCSKMKTFSREGVNMPRLQRVNRGNCLDDLNYVTTQLQNDCSKVWEKFAW